MNVRVVILALSIGCHAQRATSPPSALPSAPLANATPATTAHAEWSVGLVEDNRVGLRELVWLEDGKHVTWHRRPPGRIARISMCCWSATDDENTRQVFEFLEPAVIDGDDIVLQDERQLWVLSRRDGTTKYDWSDNRTAVQRFGGGLFSGATVEIRVAGQTCTSRVHRASFARACGHFLVYYDDGLFELFERNPYERVAQTIVTEHHDWSCKSHAVDFDFTVGPAKIHIAGHLDIECIH
jgi:hypothetical protein